MKKIDRRIIVITTFIFIVGLAYGLMKFLIAQKEEPKARVAPSSLRIVKAEAVKYRSIKSSVSALGRLSSLAQVDMVAEASGKISISKISLKKGAAFKKGDILFIIYRDEAVLSLKSKKSLFLNTLANTLPDIRIDFPKSEEAFLNFFSSIDIGSSLPEFPVLKDDKLKVFLASRNVLSDYYSIRKDELQLKRHTVRAPFSGTYLDVYIEEGSYTNTGGRVATAIQTDKLELEVPVKKSDAVWVSLGDVVSLSRGDEPHIWKGTVIRKGGYIDIETQQQAIYVSVINNKDPLLLPGEYFSAEFPGYVIDNSFEIPRNIVFNSDEVFIVNEGRLLRKTLNIIKINERTLIANGLEEGNMLVMQPLINVKEGTPAGILGEVVKGKQPGGSAKKTDGVSGGKKGKK
jgi:multidrug efflux pump subunit AcrA (membrane-fusion protein)